MLTRNDVVSFIIAHDQITEEKQKSYKNMIFDKISSYDCAAFVMRGKIVSICGSLSGRRRYFNDGWKNRKKKTYKWATPKSCIESFFYGDPLRSKVKTDHPIGNFPRVKKEATYHD